MTAETTSTRSTSSAPELVAIAQLWADQFRHLTTLGVAGAGGVLVLVQAQLIERGWRVALVLFLVSASIAMLGQITVVEEASTGKPPRKKGKLLLALTLLFLGGGVGATVMLVM